ncbi:hypothetical protein J4732_06685 [Serratia marcescens]|uniref:Uncharacterized protein n=1 Tax=Serratia marcescens TaxID=615 RepID=A0A939NJM8_SERMA|nr:hypothetical protein [Serratia marcescens]
MARLRRRHGIEGSKRTSTALLCNGVPVCDIAGLSPGNLRGVVFCQKRRADMIPFSDTSD